MKHAIAQVALAATLLPLATAAQISDDKIRIGVLTDISGLYADFSGNGSVEAARMAVEALSGTIAGKPVEVVYADHQNRVDIGSAIARKWFDTDGVDLILDVPHSAIALAVAELAQARNKAVIFSSAATADLTGRKCSPNHVAWVWDTWVAANNTARLITQNGGDSWFLLTTDYTFGRMLAQDVRNVVDANGGKVVGEVRHPLNNQDFASFLLQAQASKAKIIGLANAGADTANAIKQAAQFGIGTGDQQIAGMMITLPDVRALGLERAQNMYLSTTFYWDLNDETRAFTKALAARNKGIYADQQHAGVYASVLHYAKAVERAGTDAGDKVVAAMKAIPTDDPLFGKGRIRQDGRKIHPVHLMQVKTPAQSKGLYDFYKLVATTPAEQAFQPMAEAGCPLIP